MAKGDNSVFKWQHGEREHILILDPCTQLLNFSGEGSTSDWHCRWILTYDEEMWTCWLHHKGNASDHLKKVILQKDDDGDGYVSSNGIVVTPISTFDL